MSVKWYLILVLVFISLVINNDVHFFKCSLTTHISSLEKCLVKFFAHFSFWFVCVCCSC